MFVLRLDTTCRKFPFVPLPLHPSIRKSLGNRSGLTVNRSSNFADLIAIARMVCWVEDTELASLRIFPEKHAVESACMRKVRKGPMSFL